jgi:hypothetical protein
MPGTIKWGLKKEFSVGGFAPDISFLRILSTRDEVSMINIYNSEVRVN